MASSSLAGETAPGFVLGGGAAAFFLEKSATILENPAFDGAGTERAAALEFSVVPSISDTPKEAGAVAAAMDAMVSWPKISGPQERNQENQWPSRRMQCGWRENERAVRGAKWLEWWMR